MGATDARPIPKKGIAYRHYFAIRDNAGALVTTWAGADSEVSKDGDAFADATNEATEIGSSGCGYIDLTTTEMNADAIMLVVTVTNTDALAYVVTFFPEEAGDIRTNLTQINGAGQTATLDTIKAETALIVEDTGTDIPAALSALTTSSIQTSEVKIITQGANDILIPVAFLSATTKALVAGITVANIDYKIIASKRGSVTGAVTSGDVATTFSGDGGVYDGAADGVALKELSGGFYILGLPDTYFNSSNAYDFLQVVLTDGTGSTICPVIIEFQVVPFSLDTIIQNVNVTKISDDSTAADTLETFVEALGSDSKPILSSEQSTLSVNLEDDAITQDAIAANIGSTAYASNKIALAVNKALENINLNYLLKDAATLNTHITNTSVLAYLLAVGGDVSDYNPTLHSLENLYTVGSCGTDSNTKITDIQTKLTDVVEDNAGTYRFTAAALALAPNQASVGDLSIRIALRTDADVNISNATVWLNTTNDRSGSVITPQVTNSQGVVYFDVAATTYYVFAKHNDWTFATTDNDIEVVDDNDSFILKLATAVAAPSEDTGAYDDSFLTRSIAEFRNSVDEPELNAKYSEDDIIAMLSSSYTQLLGEMNRNASTPVVVKYQITVSSGTSKYILPVNRSSIYAIYTGSESDGFKVYYNDGGRYNELGRNIWIEGNTLNVNDTVFDNITLTIEYTPLGNAKFVEGSVTSINSSGTGITVHGSPNKGTLSNSYYEYVGSTFRILYDTDTDYNVVQERTITAFDPINNVITVDIALSPNAGDGVHSGNTYYEIVPVIERNLDIILTKHCAWGIANREGMKKRADGLLLEYRSLVRNLRLNSFYSDLDKAIKLNPNNYDNKYGKRRFRDGRRL